MTIAVFGAKDRSPSCEKTYAMVNNNDNYTFQNLAGIEIKMGTDFMV